MLKNLYKKRASVLILSLWVLSTLTIFAVYIGLKVRQRVTLLARLEDRSQLHYITEAGVEKAIASLRKDYERNQSYSPYSKYYRHNNPESFARIVLGNGAAKVSFVSSSSGSSSWQEYYGMTDEEGKLNVNIASREELERLIKQVLSIRQNQADELVDSFLSWRSKGQARIEGFYSDDYYRNLQYPYEAKHAFFEVPDELLLLKGMTTEIFEKLFPFITIYGDGRVNMNTVSEEVLLALGLSQEVVEKILTVRRGSDAADFTGDDHVFSKTYDIASELGQFLELKEPEAKEIDTLNRKDRTKTNSSYYRIRSVGKLDKKEGQRVAWCVYNLGENRIEYYKEGR